MACRGGTRGSIRAWSLQEDHDNSKKTVGIMYQISRNRYCEMVGREHRSNNIYWTIDFKTWSCVQGCHDRECVGRGVPLSIPQDALTQIQQEYEAWQEEEFEKALLALNLDDYPSPQTNALSDLSDDALLEAMEANPELFP
uniref:DNA-directed primase/polymerase protein n=1 Tax=Craspedostauros australis TaxID=1486917 RepID=A0A7R9ZQM5_9STRA